MIKILKNIKDKFKKYQNSEFDEELEIDVNIPIYLVFFILAFIMLICYFIFK